MKAKQARAQGEEYVSRSGKNIPAKKVCTGDLCGEMYRLNCTENLKVPLREELFKTYYSLDHGKHQFLFACMEGYTPIQSKKIREMSFRYFVVIRQERISLCRSALLSLFSISASTLYKAQKAWKRVRCSTSPIKQGRNPASLNAVKVSEEKIDEVRMHISKFPAVSSHYCRHKNPNRQYLHYDLNIYKMYELYK